MIRSIGKQSGESMESWRQLTRTWSLAEGLVKTYRKKCCAFRCLVLRLELNVIFCVSFTCNCKCDVYEKKNKQVKCHRATCRTSLRPCLSRMRHWLSPPSHPQLYRARYLRFDQMRKYLIMSKEIYVKHCVKIRNSLSTKSKVFLKHGSTNGLQSAIVKRRHSEEIRWGVGTTKNADLMLKYNGILGLVLQRNSTNHCKNFKQFTAQCK